MVRLCCWTAPMIGIDSLQSQLKFRLAERREGKLAPSRRLPLVVEPRVSRSTEYLCRAIRAHRDEWNEQLWRHGGILFRGFAVDTAKQFEAVAGSLDSNLSPNHPLDDLVREWRSDYVFEAMSGVSAAGSANLLPFHNEDSYLPTHPEKIMFYCLRAPEFGGETPIVDCREVLGSLPDRLVRRFVGRKLRSTKCLSFDMVTANTGTDDRLEIEEICRAHQIEKLAWRKDGSLELEAEIDPVITHPQTGEAIWFNRAKGSSPWGVIYERILSTPHCRDLRLRARAIYRTIRLAMYALSRRMGQSAAARGKPGTTYSGGETVSIRDQLLMVRAYWKHAVVLTWLPGDVLLLDNRIVAHGRMPFLGHRVILGCVTQATGVEVASAECSSRGDSGS